MPRKIKRQSSLKKKKTASKRVSFSDDLKGRGRSAGLKARKSITRNRSSLKKRSSSSDRCPPIPTSAQAQLLAKKTVAQLRLEYGVNSAMFRCKGALIAALLQRKSGAAPKIAVQVADKVASIPNPAEVAKQIAMYPSVDSKYAKEDLRYQDDSQALVPVSDKRALPLPDPSEDDPLDHDYTPCADLKDFFGDDPKATYVRAHPDKYCANLSGDDQDQCKKDQAKTWSKVSKRYKRFSQGKCSTPLIQF